MEPEQIIQVVDEQTWLDKIGKPVQQWIADLYQSSGQAGNKIKDFLSGVWLGHPLHPVITDVPIGAWTAAALMDGMEMTTGNRAAGVGADAAVTLGAAAAVGAAITGLSDWHYTTGRSRRVGTLHALLNITALGFYIGSLAARSSHNRQAGRGLALLGYTIAAASAFLGGDLVFGERIGVDHAPELTSQENFTAVMDEKDLEEGKMQKVNLGETPILVARLEGQVYAMADTCAHLGGPLSEGELTYEPETGRPCVVCPWHGSTFVLENGHIVTGPSTYPQPVLETRINQGKVEVRVPPNPS